MVKHYFSKSYFYFREMMLIVVILSLVFNLISVNIALSQKIEIGDKDVDKIKTSLDLLRTFGNIVISDQKIKNALNITIRAGETGTDITYGLFVLSAMNEMELIDMVISQRFKTEATAYFNQIIDERTNLISYWKGIGFDLPRVLFDQIQGQMSALTLNSFSIENKVLQIFLTVRNIAIVQLYNGLWGYFDYRRANFSHKDAWQNAKDLMRWMPDPEIMEKLRTLPFARFNPVVRIDNAVNQLEPRFAELWDKWGPYTDDNGVKEEFKRKFKEEMGQIVLEAIAQQALAEKEKEPSLLEKIAKIARDSSSKTVGFATNIWNAIKSIISKLNPFGQATIVQQGQSQLPKTKRVVEEGQPKDQGEKGAEKPEVKIMENPNPKEESPETRPLAEKRTEILEEDKEKEKKEEKIKEEKEENKELEEKIFKKEKEGCSPNSVNINTASVSDLEKIVGIGPGLAQRIIEARPFSSINDLIKVKGIGEKTLQKIIVQGCAYVEGADQSKSQPPIVTGGGGGGGGSSSQSSPSYPKILISEVQIEGENTNHDFIELYNPNDFEVDISGYKLRKRTSTGGEYSINILPFGSSISKKGYYLWASSEDENYPSSINANTWTKENISGNNSLALLAPDNTIISALAWGSSTNPFVEGSPFPENPGKNKSLGRIWDETEGKYKETGNNSADFKIQNPSPRTQNQNPTSQNQAPSAQFTFTPSNPIVNQPVLFDASSSTDDGTIVNYLWDFGDGNSTTTNQATTTYSFATSSNFLITLLVVDNLGATSSPATTTISIGHPPTLSVVINEIAWMGTAASSSDEWIELHNTTQNSIDLTGWKLVSLTDNSPNITLSGTTSPLGFYLLERTNDNTISDINADWVGSFGSGGLKNEGEELELRDNLGNIIDRIGCQKDAQNNCLNWFAGDNLTKQTMERINPRASGENINNWANNNQITKNGLDAGGNPINGTPKAQNSVYQSLPPNPVQNFAIDPQKSYGNKVVLNWSTTTDLDTLPENLSYKIYYSKEPVTENNLNATTTASTTISATTTLTISNLDYNSTYYFGIRAFDPQNNFSSLATTTFYRTATLTTIDDGFSSSDLDPQKFKNNGRKMARDSNGKLYVVYSKAGKIILASSTDNGITWNKIEIPNQEPDQINPSIAIDSQNNLHLVWQGKVGTSTIYQIRYAKYDGANFSLIENITNSEWDQTIPSIATDSQDNIHLFWINNQKSDSGSSKDQILYRALINGEWKSQEIAKNEDPASFSIIAYLSFVIDNKDNFHLIWRERVPTGGNFNEYLRYRKKDNPGWGEIQQFYFLTTLFAMAIDSKDNLHIVWDIQRTCFDDPNAPSVYYRKYIPGISDWSRYDSEKEILESKCNPRTSAPSIAIDAKNNRYVVWSGLNEIDSSGSLGYDRIYLKSEDSWLERKEIVSPENQSNKQSFPNLLWSNYPMINGKKVNQPKTGFAFIFYEGNELKFYASNDLTWE